jgi:hypothetical protein
VVNSKKEQAGQRATRADAKVASTSAAEFENKKLSLIKGYFLI